MGDGHDLRGAGVASATMIDARGRIDAALAEVRAIRHDARTGLLVVIDSRDLDALDAFRTAGATHFLADPRNDAELAAARRFASAAGNDRRGAFDDARDADAVRRWIAARIDAGRPVGVVVVMLSRLDIVNAAHGRPFADELIAATEARIAGVAGARGFVARIDGPGFALTTEGDESETAERAARLAEVLANAFAIDGTTAVVGYRLGVATHRADEDAAALLARARAALDEGRGSDGATIRIAEPGSTEELAVDLHHAIERGEIGLAFQPQVDMASGRVTGVEALARWDHGTRGTLGADALFAAADRADLGIALSDHIQRLVLARAAAWPKTLDGLRVSLNLTAADVARRDFAATFLGLVDASGFPRGRLTLEITESGLIEDLFAAAALLAELRGAGCRIAIDDFGTGYSSLAYLKALPLDYLKIDKAMARDITGSPRDRVIVRGVIEMARSLGFAVIAEGVETPEQRDLLAAEGCDLYQGFLFAEPLDEAGLVALMGKE